MLALGSLSPDEVQAIRLSLRVAAWAVVWSLPFGVLAALALARGRFPGKALLDTVLHLPLILPPVVLAMPFLFLYKELALLDTKIGLILVYTLLVLPMVGWISSSAMVRARHVEWVDPFRSGVQTVSGDAR